MWCSMGDEITVMVTDIDDQGKIRLSRQAVLEGWTAKKQPNTIARPAAAAVVVAAATGADALAAAAVTAAVAAEIAAAQAAAAAAAEAGANQDLAD